MKYWDTKLNVGVFSMKSLLCYKIINVIVIYSSNNLTCVMLTST